MRYPMPNYPCEFEIPDAWLIEAGIDDFALRSATAYCSTAAAVPVPLSKIEPPYRTSSTPRDWRGFDHGRLVRINWIVTGAEIEPVPLVMLPRSDFPRAPYRSGYVTDIIGFMRRLQRASNSCLLWSRAVGHDEEPGPRHGPLIAFGRRCRSVRGATPTCHPQDCRGRLWYSALPSSVTP
jgi:hypothetical protein